MALRLGRSIGARRRIDCGYGVAVDLSPMSFAAFKEIEATAWRLAREGLPLEMSAEIEALEDEAVRPEVEDRIRGAASALIVRLAVLRFGAGWDGIEAPDGSPAPLNAETVDQVFDLFPGVVQRLQVELLAPFQEVEREGNAFAPSSDTA
jgi:hypothetical protein